MRTSQKIRAGLVAACLLPFLGFSAAAQWEQRSTGFGTITACYYSTTCNYTAAIRLNPPVDAPAFEFINTTGTDITDAVFSIDVRAGTVQDTYTIGTIRANGRVVMVPGYSNDHKTHPANGFFKFSGSPEDTSDNGVDADAITFTLAGKLGKYNVTSGTIVTGATARKSNDGTVRKINFLGGPGNDDGPCDNCFGPVQIATIHAAGGAVQPAK